MFDNPKQGLVAALTKADEIIRKPKTKAFGHADRVKDMFLGLDQIADSRLQRKGQATSELMRRLISVDKGEPFHIKAIYPDDSRSSRPDGAAWDPVVAVESTMEYNDGTYQPSNGH